MENWIILISNSVSANVNIFKFVGSINEVKEKLLSIADDCTKEWDDDLLTYPSSIDDIKESKQDSSFSCIVKYVCCDYNIAAIPFNNLTMLGDN